MALRTNNKKAHIFLTRTQIVLTVLALLSCIMIDYIVMSSSLKRKQDDEIAGATVYGQGIASSIILSLDQVINTSIVLKDIYEEFGDRFISTFSVLCHHFYEDNPSIGSMYIAPNAVVAAAYPPSIQKATIGFNMLEDENQRGKAQQAIDTRKITVAGPLPLVEGGTGLLVRNPAFKNDEFAYFSVVAVDWDDFTSRVFKSINHQNSGYYVSVWKDDNFNTTTDNFGCIINDKHAEMDRRVQISIRIPNDTWYLSVEPIEGWSGIGSIWKQIAVSIFLILIFIGLIIYRQYESNKKLYEFEHDILTGLYTRSAFYRRVRKMFRENPDVNYDIVVSDIENFKLLNAVYGTKTCDQLLCYYADEFQRLNPDAILARYGGDLFVSIFKSSQNIGITDFENSVNQIAKNSPIPSSIVKYGVLGKVDKTVPPNILCDRALLAAKSILHNYAVTVSNYDGPISHKHAKEQLLEAAFADAIKNEDFKVWFQPKFDAITEELVGAEALVRWINPDGQTISPADFIYVFEEDGLIVQLDLYVFTSVCKTIKRFMNAGIKTVPISVNISRASLHHTGIIQKYKDVIEETGIPVELVPLEITETTAFKNKQIKELAEQLKAAGFRIDMDDFGTGSSSLASLNLIPFDVLKIDKSLVDFIGTPDGEELVRHSIELAHFKNIHVIAEGVEKQEQLEFLRKYGCDTIQGYYFSPPLPLEKYINRFQEYSKAE